MPSRAAAWPARSCASPGPSRTHQRQKRLSPAGSFSRCSAAWANSRYARGRDGQGRINPGERTEFEFRKQTAQFGTHAGDSRVGTQAGNQSVSQPRLAGVQFPRMEIDAYGPVLALIDATDARGRVAVRQQPEIAAATDRGHSPRRQADAGYGHLNERACLGVDHACMAAETGNSAAVMHDGINA